MAPRFFFETPFDIMIVFWTKKEGFIKVIFIQPTTNIIILILPIMGSNKDLNRILPYKSLVQSSVHVIKRVVSPLLSV